MPEHYEQRRLKAALEAIANEDYEVLGIADKVEVIRSGDGDHHVIDAMRLTARRALEGWGSDIEQRLNRLEEQHARGFLRRGE